MQKGKRLQVCFKINYSKFFGRQYTVVFYSSRIDRRGLTWFELSRVKIYREKPEEKLQLLWVRGRFESASVKLQFASYRESNVLLCALIFWPCLSQLLTINSWNARMVFIDVLLLAEVAPCEAVLLPKCLSKWSLMTTKYNNYHSLGKRMCREQECRYERSDLCPSCAWSLALAC